MKSPKRELIDALRSMREMNYTMYEQCDYDLIFDIIGSDEEAINTLFDQFELVKNGELQKLFLAHAILQKFPYLPAYVYLTEGLGRSPSNFGSSYQGIAILRHQGKIK